MTNRFQLARKDGNARRGSYITTHGTFETPNFMPVGTQATVKGVDTERLEQIGAQIMLVNTYHLWLRPTPRVVRHLGGIHRFAGWNKPILSDSGGFQIFSLQGIRTLSEKGVEFRSHIDGSKHFLSPEIAIQIQEELGVDIAMVLDECPAGDLPFEAVEKSLAMTIRWAKRSLEARVNPDTSIFAITQGGVFPELRKRAAEEIGSLACDGIAIGGLSVGEPKHKMYEVLSYHVAQLPQEKIHYLMGVGTPQDIVQAVNEGVDLFDCVMPTRSGRFGRAFVSGEKPYLNIRNAEHSESAETLDSECCCLACTRYTRGYLHHLFRTDEMLGPQLLSLHNLAHYQDLMRRIRDAIDSGSFNALYLREMERWKDVMIGRQEATT